MKFSVSIVLILAGILFFYYSGQYRYYDYADAECSEGSPVFDANLVGTFNRARPRERGNPYYLRLQISPENEIASLEVSSIDFRKKFERNEILKEKIRNPVTSTENIVYLVPAIDLPYEDIDISGQITRGIGFEKTNIPFVCIFKKTQKTEWRFSLLDVLMSV